MQTLLELKAQMEQKKFESTFKQIEAQIEREAAEAEKQQAEADGAGTSDSGKTS